MSHRGNGFTGLGGALWSACVRAAASLLRRRELVLCSGGRVRHVALPAAVQIAALMLVVGGAWWVAQTSYVWIGYHQIIAGKDGQIERYAAKNRELLATIATLRGSNADFADTLARNRAELAALVVQKETLQRELGQVRAGLRRADGDRAANEARQAALRGKINQLEAKLATAEKHSADLGGSLETARTALADAKRAQGAAASARDTLKERVSALEKRLVALRVSQHKLVGRVSQKTEQDISRIERIIAGIGLNPNKLLAQAESSAEDDTAADDQGVEEVASGDSENGQGGPFIPYDTGKADVASPSDSAATADTAPISVALKDYNRRMARWEDLQRLLASLPLAMPLDHFRLSSGFGKRHDPVNNRLAMHEGVDLSAPRGTAVHATAGGKVVYAGWDGRYGRMIEVDHGYGVHTRYAHLNRILVRKNQTVKAGQKVGEVGNTGRSTGSHLHYGVLVDRKWFDPERFMKAGKDVFKG
jgi:murein DD-endopeptidase MepM/ murein hydrolase activator NlpD